MFGHIETLEERVEHLLKLRDTQNRKPDRSFGFLSFIPWPFQSEGTVLKDKHNISAPITPDDYIRLIAFSRIVLQNIPNIQASWLTVGVETGKACLHAGANDFGSIMIEENVVSAAGANYQLTAEGMKQAITEAGFEPVRRNQRFEYL